jgi:hypothetical protein
MTPRTSDHFFCVWVSVGVNRWAPACSLPLELSVITITGTPLTQCPWCARTILEIDGAQPPVSLQGAP